MDPKSFRESKDRAANARKRLAAFEALNPADFRAVVTAWEDFLGELIRAFNKLYHGDRTGTPAAAIVRRMREDGSTDPLLRYLRESRNVLEHGHGLVASTTGSLRPFAPGEPRPAIWMTVLEKGDDGKDREVTYGPESVGGEIVNQRPVLRPLELGGRVIEPPIKHLGQPIDSPTPATVGRLALDYLAARHDEIRAAMDN